MRTVTMQQMQAYLDNMTPDDDDFDDEDEETVDYDFDLGEYEDEIYE